MAEGRQDRRQTGKRYRGKPRSSPASLVVLTVSGVLLATAAMSVLFGGRHSDATPHGRLLGTLQEVAEAQETHYRARGEFTWRGDLLEVEPAEGVELVITRGNRIVWEARVSAPEHGISCVQTGRWADTAPAREEPVCYREAS